MTLGLRKQERQFSLRGEYRDGSNANKATSCPSLPGTNRFLGYRTSVLKPGKFQSKQGRLDHSSRNKICTESMFSSLLPTTPLRRLSQPTRVSPVLHILSSTPQHSSDVLHLAGVVTVRFVFQCICFMSMSFRLTSGSPGVNKSWADQGQELYLNDRDE